MNWRCGSSGKKSALQVQHPKFKPQSHQKGKKKTLSQKQNTKTKARDMAEVVECLSSMQKV
jgi:hypothetical protein